MRRTVRPGVFETNSSMTHTLIIATKEDVDRWHDGELFWFDGWSSEKRLVTPEERDKIIADPNNFWSEEDFMTYEDFESDRGYYELEHSDGEFVSPSGDQIVWMAAYGHD